MKRILSLLLASLLLCALPAAGTLQAFAENAEDILWSFETDVEYTADSVGSYVNWAGVSNVAQFTDAQGRFCFACDGDDAVTVYTTEKGEVISELQIPKAYSLFGTIVCDADGYLYIVWGEPNAGTDASVDTVFVSKYDGSGQLLQTVGDNGGAIAASIPDSDSFNTRIPFNGGNCDAAINNGVLMVNYARKMYSGHQSNALFAVNTATMEKATSFINYFSAFYNSHSFDQRVTPYGNDGFLLESHGDCYDRTFKTGLADCT